MRLRNLAIAGLFLLLPLSARADADWFASLYTNEGIELRADERIFTLYSLLNAAGYDESPLVRQFPVPARDMHPVRLKIRQAVRLEPGQLAKANGYFDAHPLPASLYARYVLALKGPGGFERTPAAAADLKGAEALLADVYGRQKLAELFASTQDEYRSALKGYHGVVDAPVMATRKLLKLKDDELARVVLVVNLLDARGRSFSQAVGEELYVVLGPSREPDLFAVAKEISRARLFPLVTAKLGGAKGLSEAMMAAREAGAEADSPADFATEVLARSFAARALNLSETELEAQARGGYAAVREVTKAVEAFAKNDKQALDAFVSEGLALVAKDPKEAAGKKKGK